MHTRKHACKMYILTAVSPIERDEVVEQFALLGVVLFAVMGKH